MVNPKIKGIFWLLTAFIICEVHSAQACFNLRFGDGTHTNYNLNANSDPTLTVELRRDFILSGCNYFVTISNGHANSYTNRSLTTSQDEIPLQIYENAPRSLIIKDFPEANNNADVINGSFSHVINGWINRHNYYLSLGEVGYNRHGSYQDIFTLKLYEGKINGSYRLKDTQTLTLTYNMEKKIDLSLVNSGGTFDPLDTTQTLNFGTLVAGAARGFDLKIMYNAGYKVKFSSTNNGKMKHTSHDDLVTYSMKILGVPVDLSNSRTIPKVVASGGGVSPPSGRTFDVQAVIGSLGTARAGNYRDIITITVETLE